MNNRNKFPMKLVGIIGIGFSIFCIFSYMLNEEAISVQVMSAFLNWIWGVTTIFAVILTVCAFLEKKKLLLISLAVIIVSMLVYFGTYNLV